MLQKLTNFSKKDFVLLQKLATFKKYIYNVMFQITIIVIIKYCKVETNQTK